MARSSFYDLDMSKEKSAYRAEIAKAENTNKRNGYQPSVDEYNYYVKAMEHARNICNLNVQQPAVYRQWSERANDCEKKARELLKKLDLIREQEEAAKKAEEAARKAEEAAKAAAEKKEKQVSAEKSNNENDNSSSEEEEFKTNNASDDVPVDVIKKWYQKKPDHGFDDIVGMEEMKERLRRDVIDNVGWDSTDELLGISKTNSILFYGPFGTGKTFFIEAVAKELMDKGFKFIQLRGSDLHNSYVGVGEKIVETAFREAVDNAPCVLFFDEFENVCKKRDGNTEAYQQRLTVSFMESYNLIINSKKPIIFMAATNYPDQIEGAMLSRILNYILVPLPSEEVRLNYFKKSFEKISLSDDLKFEHMAEMTENYSFRDLDKIKKQVIVTVKDMGVDLYTVYDDDGNRLQKESDESVMAAIKEGKVKMTADLFDATIESNPPEKKKDILESIEAFEKKI